MKYIYWGAINSGKADIYSRCILEEKPYIFFKKNYIHKCVPTKINENTYRDDSYNLWMYNEKYTETHIESRLYNREKIFQNTEINPQVTIDFISTEYNSWIVDRKKHIISREYSKSLYKELPSITPILETVDYAILGNVNFIHEDVCLKDVLSLNNTKHIIPYRVIKDPVSIISKINMYDDGDYFQLYKNNKCEAFKFLDKFVIAQRTVEKYLLDNNIEITYFDLDSFDYSVCGFESNIVENLSIPDYNLKNPDIKQKYDLAYSIAQEYLDTRCLTDTRIRGTAIDGIEV